MYTLRRSQIYRSQVIECGWMRLQITENVWDEYRYNCTLCGVQLRGSSKLIEKTEALNR